MEDRVRRAACWGTDSLVGPPPVGQPVVTVSRAQYPVPRNEYRVQTLASRRGGHRFEGNRSSPVDDTVKTGQQCRERRVPRAGWKPTLRQTTRAENRPCGHSSVTGTLITSPA